MKTITMTEIKAVNTWSVKDDSPRGCKTVSNDEVKPGDMVVYNDRFTLVIDDTQTETAEEKAERENRETCKYIAEIVDTYANEDGYKCPHCNEFHTVSEYEKNEHTNKDGETVYTCPECGEDIDDYELEAVSIYDYFSANDIYDTEYRIGFDRELRTVSIMIACGGPNIYIDTREKAVILRWWSETAEYPIAYETAEKINEYFEELYNC